VLIRDHGEGLMAHTLNLDYEVRSAEEAQPEHDVDPYARPIHYEVADRCEAFWRNDARQDRPLAVNRHVHRRMSLHAAYQCAIGLPPRFLD
jgi:non-homologous end joining protein Ku